MPGKSGKKQQHFWQLALQSFFSHFQAYCQKLKAHTASLVGEVGILPFVCARFRGVAYLSALVSPYASRSQCSVAFDKLPVSWHGSVGECLGVDISQCISTRGNLSVCVLEKIYASTRRSALWNPFWTCMAIFEEAAVMLVGVHCLWRYLVRRFQHRHF